MLPVLLAGLWLAASVPAAAAESTVVLELKDGSRLSGRMTVPAFALRTDYARMEIPWSSVAECRFPADGQPVTLVLASSERLSGRLDAETLSLESALGTLAVPVTAMAFLLRREPAFGTNGGVVRGASASSNLPVKVRLEMTEGSCLTGDIAGDSITFTTRGLGKVPVPFRLVRRVEFSKEGRKAAADLLNGDRLCGEPLPDELKLKTDLGDMSLPRGLIKTLVPAGPPDVGAPAVADEAADPGRLAGLVAELDQPDPERREAAVRALVKIGAPALPALKHRAAESAGPGAWWVKAAIQEIERKTR